MINMMNKKKWFFGAALAALLLMPRGVGAIIGTVDNVPGATLLVPYFEVDMSANASRTTLFSINNASATAILTKVTLWTDLGVPTLSFNVYLTGYDVQTINVHDLLDGTVPSALPQTASAGQDPQDKISPKGAFSQDINFASCTTLGLLPPPALTPTYTQGLRSAHVGDPSSVFGSLCGARNWGDNVARGYITVDTINSCTNLKPGDSTYFTSVATFQNVLWGDYFFVDTANNFAQGDAAVSIEASTTDPLTTTANKYTFYGHLDDTPWDATDHREALGSTSMTRFVNGGTFTGGTNVIAWRDARVKQVAFTCGTLPPGLVQQDLMAFDEQEQAVDLNTLAPFQARTQKIKVNGPFMPVAPTFGWLYMNLKHANGTGPSGGDIAAAQSYVSYTMDASGRFSVSQPAVVRENTATSVSGCLNGTSLVNSQCQ